MSVNSDAKVANLDDKLDQMTLLISSPTGIESSRIRTKLDGIDSTGFVQGIGETIHRRRSCQPPEHPVDGRDLDDLFPVQWQQQWSG